MVFVGECVNMEEFAMRKRSINFMCVQQQMKGMSQICIYTIRFQCMGRCKFNIRTVLTSIVFFIIIIYYLLFFSNYTFEMMKTKSITLFSSYPIVTNLKIYIF